MAASERPTDRIMAPVVRVLKRLNMTPNRLTLTGMAFSFLVAVCIGLSSHQNTRLLTAAGLLLVFSGLFDMWDGALSRMMKTGGPFGAFFDSITDRFSDAVVLIGCLVAFIEEPAMIVIIALTILGFIMVSFSRAQAEVMKLECKVGLMQRTERTVLLAVGCFTNKLHLTIWVLFILTWFTALQRIIYILRRLRKDALASNLS